jgi:ferritin
MTSAHCEPLLFNNVTEWDKKTMGDWNYITGRINFLTSIAHEEKDYATVNELQWFVAEQVEEEANANEILEQLKFINGEGHGIFMIDRELKTRVFVDRTLPQGNAAN